MSGKESFLVLLLEGWEEFGYPKEARVTRGRGERTIEFKAEGTAQGKRPSSVGCWDLMGREAKLRPWDKGHVVKARVSRGGSSPHLGGATIHPSIQTSLRLPLSLSGAQAALALPTGLPRELLNAPLCSSFLLSAKISLFHCKNPRGDS